MSMSSRQSDRRVNRTLETLHQVFLALMLEKRYDDITVQNIIDRANVGRSTFYAHYRDKEDLAVSNLAQILDSLTKTMDQDDPDSQSLLPGPELFEHIRDHYQVFKTMVGW